MDYQSMTVAELRDVAGDYDIKGRWDMTKDQLLAAVSKSSEKHVAKVVNQPAAKLPVVEPAKKEVPVVPASKFKNCKNHETHADRVSKAKVGDIVAFMCYFKSAKDKTPLRKMLSGKIMAIDEANDTEPKTFTIQTVKGSVYKLEADDIEWVKTNARWPHNIFEKMNSKPEVVRIG